MIEPKVQLERGVHKRLLDRTAAVSRPVLLLAVVVVLLINGDIDVGVPTFHALDPASSKGGIAGSSPNPSQLKVEIPLGPFRLYSRSAHE